MPDKLARTSAFAPRRKNLIPDSNFSRVYEVPGSSLAAVRRIERVVDVKHYPFGNLPKGAAIEIDHSAAHAQKGAGVWQVLQPGNGRLRTQFAIGRRQIERHFEQRVAS